MSLEEQTQIAEAPDVRQRVGPLMLEVAEPAAIELSIVMPCLNETETLEGCITSAQRFLERHGVSGEVVVADNGSTDGSQTLAQRLGARVIDVPVKGYGAALHGGILAARGRYVIMGDSDGSYDFENLLPMLQKLRDGHDLVMGNRFAGGITRGAMPWKNRWLGNPVLSAMGRLLFRCPVGDFHCGLRGFSADGYRRMDLRTMGMEFASEMVMKSAVLGMKITEVPTTLRPDGRSRPPHLRPWRDGWRHVRFMLLYSPRWLFLYPGLVLMLLGLAVGALVWSGPRRVGPAVLDIHTLVYAAGAVLLGFQAITFALVSRVFAVQEGLLPEDRRLKRMYRWFKLEVALIGGAGLVLAGIALTVYALGIWGGRQFGELDPRRTMRLVVPGMTFLTLGFQMILSGFFFSMLGLRVRPVQRGIGGGSDAG